MIMAWREFPTGSLACYSFGGTFRECHDARIARRVANACGQTHKVIQVGKEFLSQFGHYAERSVYLTDGCVHVTHSPDLYVNQIAAQIAPVRMTGNYGGEVLRSTRAFKPVEPSPGLFADELQPHFLAAKQTYSSISDVHPVTFAAFRQAPWHHVGLLSLEQTQLTLRTPFLDNQILRAAYRAPISSLQGAGPCLGLIGDGNPSLLQIPTDRGLGGVHNGFRAAWSRNYLDVSAKAEYAYDYGMPQWVAAIDYILSPLKLERLFLGRHKFYHFRVWYRDVLRDYVRETLLDSRSLSRPYVNRAKVESIVEGHLRGSENHTTSIHKLLTLELAHRLFIDA
ncbi:MAG TPA: asparagine synthase-related protein, partial [Nitrospiraceae bacterium]|nr:asparagine synthase-related protein [Nitrospiraceae bacterium]